jgi:serine/threonine protein kinase
MDKGSDLLKVTDFGLAKDFGGVDAKLSTSCGTPDFAGTSIFRLQVFV